MAPEAPIDLDPRERPADGRARLLVIDDDPLMRKLLSRVLTGKGYEAVAAHDGVHARELFAREAFDLVLSDIHMPRADGITVLQDVRERDPDLPVILFTGSQSAQPAIRALQLRATAYLTKPIDPGRLIDEVEKALRMHGLARVRKRAHELVRGEPPADRGRAEDGCRFDRALDGIYMLYQPIVSWRERRAFGYEALVRSSEPSLPHPAALFDAAERLGRWNDLGGRIRARSIEPLGRGGSDFTLFLNLHAREMLDESLYDPASAFAALAPRVVLEITERAHLGAVPGVAERVERLRALGFRIAIDDIGAGYSGLSSFAMLRPELVKLDQALVRGIDGDPVKRRLAALVVQMCADLGIGVVGEGIESAAERDTLLELGCDLFQGYLFGAPAAPFATPAFE